MEVLRVLNDAEAFDQAVHGSPGEKVLPDFGDAAFLRKARATIQGQAGICITFTVQLPDGTKARAQTVVTEANFLMAADACRGWKSREGKGGVT
jgi:hypothetical protein